MTELFRAETAAPSLEGPQTPLNREAGLSIRLKTVLWLALLAAGASLRLVRLDDLPFTLGESARALDALRVAQGNVPDTWSGDLSAALASYLFRLFPESELLARIVPAVAGCVLIAALWFASRVMGSAAALLSAALLALSPLAILVSRSALPFSLGALLSIVMVVSLFAYLREQRASSLFPLAVSLALAPTVDAVATATAISVLLFLLAEGAFRRDSEVAEGWRTLRRNPSHWVSVLFVFVAALELGLTHFGTSVRRLGLPGLTQWGDMFALPRDDRAPEYQLALLLAYDWPLLLAGLSGFALLAQRLLARGRRSLSPLQRFLLLWTVVAALTVALATQREAGQLLIVLLPLALLGGSFLDELLSSLDWPLLRRWWPLPLASLLLIAYGALLLTRWSSPGGTTRAEEMMTVLALGGAAAIIAAAYPLLARETVVLLFAVVAALALAFTLHSALWTGLGDGAEFAADPRAPDEIAEFQLTVEQLVLERSPPILVDPSVAPAIAWYIRDSPLIVGAVSPDVTTIIAPADPAPPGFTALGRPWRVVEGWYPEDVKLLPLWRWLVYRTSYGNLVNETNLDVSIFVRTP